MTEDANELLRYLAEEWTALLVQILESMTDQKPKATWKSASAPAADGMLWWAQNLNLAQAPLIWVGAAAQAWNDLGGRTLRAAGIETADPADAKNTYFEILSQSLAGLAQSLSARMGSEITCAKGEECVQAPAEAEWIAAEILYDDAVLQVSIGCAPGLLDALEHPREARPAAPSAALEKAPAEPAAFVPHASKTLDLLLDVELPVSVSFGRAELLLKDVLKLTTGSIVELNRGVSEPVEVIVNNCVVARGEVVVMDGNYGVRIHQIISPQERLRTLK